MYLIAVILFLSLLLVGCPTLSTAQHVPQETEFINLRNYGCVLQPVKTLIPTCDSWLHTLALNLSILTDIQLQTQENCAEITNAEHAATCTRYYPLIKALQKMDRKAAATLKQTVNHVFDILHDTLPTENINQRRGLLDFIGGLSQSLFGTALDSDVQRNRAMIQQLQKATLTAVDTVAIHADKLASFMQLSNSRFDKFTKLVETQQQEFSTLVSQYRQQFSDTQTAQMLIAQALNRMVDFTLNIEHINSFEQAILFLSHGYLTPEIVPVSVIQETLNILQATLDQIHSPFNLVRIRPEDVYSSRDFHLWIEDKVLFITLRFPFSPFVNPITLYKITTVPTPLPQQPEHFTRIQNLPKFVAFHPDEELFLSFDDMPQIPESNLLNLQLSTHLLLNKTMPSCLAALISKSADRISQLCKFEFQANKMTPLVIHVETSRLLLIHVPTYDLRCPNGTTTKTTPSAFVEVEIPCSCSFISQYGVFAGRTMACDPAAVTEPTYSFPVNLQVLRSFFTNDEISTLSASKAFDTPVPVIMPNITVLEHSYAQTLADVKDTSLKLDQVTNLTQAEAAIYRSATDKLLFDITNSDLPLQSSSIAFFSYQNILLLATSAAVIILAFVVYTMSGKLRALLITVSMAAHTPGVALAQSVSKPPLNYYLGLPSSTPSVPLMPFELDYRLPTLDFVLLLLMASVIVILGILWYKQNVAIKDSFQLLLELGTPHDRVLLTLMTLPHTPAMYSIEIAADIENLLVTGCLFPELQITWGNVTVFNKFSGLNYPVPRVLHVSIMQARSLRAISDGPHYSLLFCYANKQLSPITPPERQMARPSTSAQAASLYPQLLPPYNGK